MTHTTREAGPVGRLALADGSLFSGVAFGATGQGITREAEVVFNTAMTGYQESLTDPSYCGQILVQTTPLIGNTGVNGEDVESGRVQVAGFVVHELARRHSNYRANNALPHWLAEAGVIGLAGIDTRALTRVLRSAGAIAGVITDDASISDRELVERARNAGSMEGQNLIGEVGRSEAGAWAESMGDWSTARRGVSEQPFRVLAIDCGAKRNILRNLVERGCEVKVIPHTTPASEIRAAFSAGEFDGLFVSNGPGDPAAVEETVACLRELLDCPDSQTIPTFGICLGHQMLALALGASTYKLKFGHRGANQPVESKLSGRVEITSQNHGFAVDVATIESVGGEATHIHLNDGTLAGFRLKDRPVFAVQHHPEASPGPHDSGELFDRFVEMMKTRTATPIGV